MTMEEEVTGLCVNCNHNENCIYLTFVKDSVVCCEEYDSFMPVQQLPQKNNDLESRVDDISHSDEFTGLCINCDNNTLCKTAVTPGGVWHCEEYR